MAITRLESFQREPGSLFLEPFLPLFLLSLTKEQAKNLALLNSQSSCSECSSFHYYQDTNLHLLRHCQQRVPPCSLQRGGLAISLHNSDFLCPSREMAHSKCCTFLWDSLQCLLSWRIFASWQNHCDGDSAGKLSSTSCLSVTPLGTSTPLPHIKTSPFCPLTSGLQVEG